jgi:signal transduction histidine kinase
MGLSGVVTSRLPYAATHFTPEFPRISFNADLEDGGDERLAERTRIAQELHDTLLQGFFSVSMQLNDAVDRLPADFPAKQRFGDLLRVMERVLEEGRSTVQNLRSSREHSESLAQAFASVPCDLGYSAVGFRVVVDGKEQKWKAGLRDEVYLIVREAIVNACRHSRAGNIEVKVAYRRTELRISVRDNGRGIDPHNLQWGCKGHWGLQGMRERAERVGARLRLWSRIARGTEVELRVPGQVAFEQRGDLFSLSRAHP